MKNWRKVKLGSLLTESKVISERPNTDNRISVKLNVQGVEKRPATKDKKGATKYYIRKAGQFIYGKQNLHKGAFGIIPQELDGFESSLDIPAFDIDKSCYPEWIFYFFKKGGFYLKLESLAKGVGSKRIHPKQIFELYIFLPSKEEQRKVLDEIEKAETKNQELIKEIDSQEEILKKLRQSILQDAIQGKLTKEWREQNKIIESASVLLENIRAEKQHLIKEKKIKAEKKLLEIQRKKFPFGIPESWVWSCLDDIVSVVAGVTKGKKSTGEMKSTPYLRVANVQRGYLDLREMKDILVSVADYEKYQLRNKDILIIEGGDRDKVGRGAVWNEDIEGCIYQNHILRLRAFNSSQMNEEFILIGINSKLGREYFERNAKQTTNLASINKTVVRAFTLPIPPLEEQKKIVDKVTKLASNCDTLEHEIITNKENSEKLLQSVLIELLGQDNNELVNINSVKEIKQTNTREGIYNSKTLHMDLVKILKENGKLHAEDLWKMSKYPDDIDAFYAELKKQVEQKKTIKESEEKGYLEVV